MSNTAIHRPQISPLAGSGILELRLGNLPEQRYFLAVPAAAADSCRVLVLVHGISRNARLLVESTWPLLEGKSVILVAPLFEENRCGDYQRLGRSGKGPRADLIIQCILEEVRQLTGWFGHKALFFGHSAGAQFTQRFLFAHPQLVERAALSSAGCYTFPSDDPYPRGIRPSPLLPGIRFEPLRFLRVPTSVFVGREDTIRDETLNRSRKIDSQQGRNRLDRARRWVTAMNKTSQKLGLSTQVDLFEIDGMGHDYSQAIQLAKFNESVVNWLLSKTGVVKS